MGRAIESARTEHQRVGTLFNVVDKFFRSFVRLLIVDQERNRVGDDPRQRYKIGARRFHGTIEQLVDLRITGNAGVMRKQRVSVRLGAGDHLRPDLTGSAGLGLDDHWLL